LPAAPTAIRCNSSFLGPTLSDPFTSQDGVILGLSTMPVVRPGDPVFHIAVAPEPFGRLEGRITRPKGREFHRRLKRQLATSVLVNEEEESSDGEKDQ
jgi:hypothetical protein